MFLLYFEQMSDGAEFSPWPCILCPWFDITVRYHIIVWSHPCSS